MISNGKYADLSTIRHFYSKRAHSTYKQAIELLFYINHSTILQRLHIHVIHITIEWLVIPYQVQTPYGITCYHIADDLSSQMRAWGEENH